MRFEKLIKIKTVILEDEAPARRRLERLVNNHPNMICCALLKNGNEALQKLSNISFDLLLMDIELKDKNSFSIIEKLDLDSSKIIFVTAYDQYAISAFDLHVSDYLLKPFSDARFLKAIERFMKTKKTYLDKNISLKDGNKTYFFDSNSIILIQSDQHYVNIIEKEKKTTVRYSITRLGLELAKNFIRINKSTIINLDKVKSSRKNKSHTVYILAEDIHLKSSKKYVNNDI